MTGYQNAHDFAGYDPSAVYMFQVSGDTEDSTRAVQVSTILVLSTCSDQYEASAKDSLSFYFLILMD